MQKHNNKEEVKILGGKCTIYTNQYGIWQFRLWLTADNKYVRKSLKTRVKSKAIADAEELYIEIKADQKKGKKFFAISTKQAVEDYLKLQERRVGKSDFNIVIGRFKTIKAQMNTFLDQVGKDVKVNSLSENTLTNYERNGKETNYVAFRQSKGITDVTIRNEMVTFNNFIKECFSKFKVTHVARFDYPKNIRKRYRKAGPDVARSTFTADEYTKFQLAMQSYTNKQNTKNLSDKEKFERQMVRHYLLASANGGFRSSELRLLEWHNVKIYKEQNRRGKIGTFAEVIVEAHTSKVRETRTVAMRGGDQLDRWKQICKAYGREITGFVFSFDGKTAYDRTNTHRRFKHLLELAEIDAERRKLLVPYSLRHYHITQKVMSGLNFSQIALMVGSSTKEIEKTYVHLNKEILRSYAKYDYVTLDNGDVRII